MRRRVLVLDGGRTATPVAAVRALDTAGWSVGVGTPGPSPAARSRAVSRVHRLPDAADGLSPFLSRLQELLRTSPYDVVVPSSDAEVLALSLGRDELPVQVPLPSHPVVLRGLDKLELTRAAAGVGLRTPLTLPATEVPAGDPRTWAVKPRLHGERRPGAPSSLSSTRRVTGGRAVHEMAARMAAAGWEPLAQEVVDGALVAHVTVLDGAGRPLAALHQRAVTVHPYGAGSSARARVVPFDDALAASCRALLDALGWYGLVQLQLLAPADEPPALIDLNGRLYGSLALALAAGINLPALWVDSSTSSSDRSRLAATVLTGRAGARYSATGKDVRQALLGPEPSAAGVLAALRAAPGAAHPLWDARDPRPWLSWTTAVLRGWSRRILGLRPRADVDPAPTG